jgi:transposase
MSTFTFLEIPGELWERIEPLFICFERKRPGGSGPTPSPFRTLLAGMLYRLKTACQWRMVPKHYGSKSTLHEHYQRWAHAGLFAEILRIIATEFHDSAGFDFAWQSSLSRLVGKLIEKLMG